MKFNCFWVTGECIADESNYTCIGCAQYPYGAGMVAPPSVPSDFGQQMMGIHIGLAELLMKKGIAKPEEVDEAIARNIERLASQDHLLRETVRGVDHVADTMVRVAEPGRLDVYVAVDGQAEADPEAVKADIVTALASIVPSDVAVNVIIAEASEPEDDEDGEQPRKPPGTKAGSKKNNADQSGD